jgi:hypothetical protein
VSQLTKQRWAATKGVALLKKAMQTCEEEGDMKLLVVAGFKKPDGSWVSFQ